MVREIPKERQIRAMIDGSSFDLVRQITGNDIYADFDTYITVDRSDIQSFLESHPDIVSAILPTRMNQEPVHERILLRRAAGGGYEVSVSDHGAPSESEFFASAERALAHMILLEHGLYDTRE